MNGHYLLIVSLLILLPVRPAQKWVSSLCSKDAHCPANKCCDVITSRAVPRGRSRVGNCVDKGRCQRGCVTDTDCHSDQCCKVSQPGARRGTCTPKVTYRGVCLAVPKMLAPIGQHFVCPCSRGLKCTGTGYKSGYGESGICKDLTHPARCGHDGHCSGHRCCRYGYCVIPIGGAKRHRCGAFRI